MSSDDELYGNHANYRGETIHALPFREDGEFRRPEVVPPESPLFLRDQFASAAMQALASSGIEWPDTKPLAAKAYEIADAMMEARAK